MKERPILFSASMVRALLDGSKTQTRRAVKGLKNNFTEAYPHEQVVGAFWFQDESGILQLQPCPYGHPGDRLWVRESLRFVAVGDNPHEHAVYAADGVRVRRDTGLAGWACDGMAYGLARSVPSIHMPRWASRITLEIVSVRVERLQDISEADCNAEGLAPVEMEMRPHYRALWESINGAGSWDANPWVWVVEFKSVTA